MSLKIKIDWGELLGIGTLILLAFFVFYFGPSVKPQIQSSEGEIVPQAGVVLPVTWGDLGTRMVESGVIDAERFLALYEDKPELRGEAEHLIYDNSNGNLKVTAENSGVVLNLLWALGLSNKNRILEEGPMMQYGNAGNFASTGGWTLAESEAMNYYSRFNFIELTEGEQALVQDVAKNIYRPCCNNPTHFPDCNHGMAMLGLLELMAAQGVSEEDMYRVALQVNSYWFSDTYLTIGKYLQAKGISWDEVTPKEILGYEYSSISGYREILTQVSPPDNRSSGSCGV